MPSSTAKCTDPATGKKLKGAALKACKDQHRANAIAVGQGAANAIAANITGGATLQETTNTVNTLRDVVDALWQRDPAVTIPQSYGSATAGGDSGGSDWSWLLMLGGVAAIWFFLIRK